MAYQFLLEKIKVICKDVSVISFDIFDTLLLRPYVRPTDLFLHLEYLHNKPNYAMARIRAEQYVRSTLATTPPPPITI